MQCHDMQAGSAGQAPERGAKALCAAPWVLAGLLQGLQGGDRFCDTLAFEACPGFLQHGGETGELDLRQQGAWPWPHRP